MKDDLVIRGGEPIKKAQNTDAVSVPENGGGSSQPVIQNQVSTKGVGTQIQSNTDFNVYGNDLANFANFKGNDKHDAMRMTRTAATDVKKAFMQLKHEFPDVQITFEPMPNPQTFGKRREGFFNYQQALNDWKDIAMTQIANAREATTAEEFAETRGTVVKGAISTMDTVNARADGLTDQIDERANKLEEKVENEGSKTRSAVHSEGRKTRSAVHAEGDATRAHVSRTAGVLADEIADVGHAIVNNDAEQHKRTREEIQKEADKIIDKLDPLGVDRAIESVRNLARKAGKSVKDFIRENPEVLIPGLGIPIWTAKKLFH